MTEEEAKLKWCPMVRVPLAFAGTAMANDRSERCIGSACMMWRWYSNEMMMPYLNTVVTQARRGYCGLAGKP